MPSHTRHNSVAKHGIQMWRHWNTDQTNIKSRRNPVENADGVAHRCHVPGNLENQSVDCTSAEAHQVAIPSGTREGKAAQSARTARIPEARVREANGTTRRLETGEIQLSRLKWNAMTGFSQS